MEEQDNIKAYAVYTYINLETDVKCGATPNTYSTSYPNPFTRHKIINNLISYAFKHFYNIDIEEIKPLRYMNNGIGFVKGIYFSFHICLRVVCVCVSKSPIGINIQIPCEIYDELEYVNHNFCDKEIEEYKKYEYGKDTYFYILGRKRASLIKNKISQENAKVFDSTQEKYTIQKETFSKEHFIFVATGSVEFIRIEADEVV